MPLFSFSTLRLRFSDISASACLHQSAFPSFPSFLISAPHSGQNFGKYRSPCFIIFPLSQLHLLQFALSCETCIHRPCRTGTASTVGIIFTPPRHTLSTQGSRVLSGSHFSSIIWTKASASINLIVIPSFAQFVRERDTHGPG